MDGALIAVEEHKQSARPKNHRRGVNVQFVFRVRDRCVVAAGDAWPGNRNDIVVFPAPPWPGGSPGTG
ncbi:hypothetical protein [Streptomyces acidiscabies]|uniref:hypothetical protein n=1 Tax=Streptomyces acidiscabies TaxID=42234 RepID=UPI0009531B4E|nr:hypothetical protein [Streptomyces acidiscabies]GAV38585.1 hypothetical protein Saa2_01466 [Streptomyces acidiscabies]